MKSSGVRATRTPRAPTMIVSNVTNAIAPTAASDIRPSARRINKAGEPGLQLPRLTVVEPADREKDRVEREPEHDQGEREAGHRDPGNRRHHGGDDRKRDGHRECERQAHQGQAKLRADKRPDQQATVTRILAQVAQSRNVVLDGYMIGPPDNALPAGRGIAEVGGRIARVGHGKLRRPARRIRSRTSRT